MHPLKNTQDIATPDSWVLGLLVGSEATGSKVVDSALSIMAGNKLLAPAPSQAVLDVTEPWLASRPQEAWAWFNTHPTEWYKNLGGWIQAGADRDGVVLIDGPLNNCAISPEARQLLAMEQLARQAAARLITVDDLRLQLQPEFLPAPVCSAFLAARANLNALDALNLTVEALERHRWESLCDAVLFSVKQGVQDLSIAPNVTQLLREQMLDHTLFIDVAAWTEAAASGGMFEHDELQGNLADLATRVTDVLDPGDYWMGAFPLIRTALRAGCPEILYPHLTEWDLRPWELINFIIRYDVRSDAAWEMVERVQHQNVFHAGAPGWWQAAADSNQLTELYALIRKRLMTGAAINIPCQPQLIWHM